MSKWNVNKLSVDERIASARERIDIMVNNLIRVINLHQANQIVSYSDVLQRQVPPSHGARAFVVFRDALLRSEFGLLCHFWDIPREDRNSIPTVIALIDDPDVQARLVTERGDHYRNNVAVLGDFELSDGVPLNFRLAEEEEQRCRETLETALKQARDFLIDGKLQRVQDLRHMEIAHSLAEDARKAPEKVVHGDQDHVLSATQQILEMLNLAVRHSSFAWDGTHEIARRSAESLWLNAKFDITD